MCNPSGDTGLLLTTTESERPLWLPVQRFLKRVERLPSVPLRPVVVADRSGAPVETRILS